MRSNDLVVGEDHLLGPSSQRFLTGKQMTGESSPSRGKLLISHPAVLRMYHLVKKTSGDNLEENQEWRP